MAGCHVEKRWRDAGLNTARAMGGLGRGLKGTRCGIRIAKVQFSSGHLQTGRHSCGHGAHNFEARFGGDRTKTEVLRYESRSDFPDVGFSRCCLFLFGSHSEVTGRERKFPDANPAVSFLQTPSQTPHRECSARIQTDITVLVLNMTPSR